MCNRGWGLLEERCPQTITCQRREEGRRGALKGGVLTRWAGAGVIIEGTTLCTGIPLVQALLLLRSKLNPLPAIPHFSTHLNVTVSWLDPLARRDGWLREEIV